MKISKTDISKKLKFINNSSLCEDIVGIFLVLLCIFYFFAQFSAIIFGTIFVSNSKVASVFVWWRLIRLLFYFSPFLSYLLLFTSCVGIQV